MPNSLIPRLAMKRNHVQFTLSNLIIVFLSDTYLFEESAVKCLVKSSSNDWPYPQTLI